jgi:hypothetical protein
LWLPQPESWLEWLSWLEECWLLNIGRPRFSLVAPIFRGLCVGKY